MQSTFYPATLYPADDQGIFGVEIHGINVNGCGPTADAALADAAAILQEVIDDLSAAGETVPAPCAVSELTPAEGMLCMIPASAPSRTLRINVTLPDNLVHRIDAIAPNRSAFLAESALQRLRSL